MRNQVKKNILVTGGAGFIGSHLSEELIRRGHSVVILDDFSTGQNKVDCEIIYDSVLNVSPELIARFDLVYHLAAMVGVRHTYDHPIETLNVNVLGTQRVLECCFLSRVPVIYFSSSEVYGKRQGLLKPDDDLILGPPGRSWNYAYSKLIGEAYACAYGLKGLKYAIIRLFNVVGERQTGKYGMVLPRFIEAALTDRPLIVYGDGTQKRTFLYIKEAIEQILEIEPDNQIHNIGSNVEVSIMDLAKAVIEVVGSKSKIIKVPYEKAWGDDFYDVPSRHPEVKYASRRSIKNIIKQCLEYRMKSSSEE